MELIGIRLWKGVAKQIAGISRCLPARRRVGGERRALGEKRARGRERAALGRSGEEVRLGSPFSRKLGPRGSPLLLVFFGAPKATLGMPRRIWRRFWGGINWN